MRIVSLFSGAGGLDLGLMRAGHDIVWANDIFADAVQTYRDNIGPHITTTDIRQISSKEIPECDVVVGGFPCQGFSVANRSRSAIDPRNQLYNEMVRVVGDKKPKFFIGENVKGIKSLNRGEFLISILQAFEAVGYSVKTALVNAADYGVPQSRQRMIIFGVRKDLTISKDIFPPRITHCDPDISGLEGSGAKPWVTVGEALRNYPEPDEEHGLQNHDHSRYKLRFNGHLGHRIVDPDRPAPTVTARGDDKGGVVVIHHPGNHRRMTARELAAVQSFPDDFVFYGPKSSAYRQIANAVPPLLGEAIGRMLSSAEASILKAVA